MLGKRSMKVLVFLLLVVCLILTLTGAALAAGGPRAVMVDAGKTIGAVRSLQGAHWDPGPAGSALSNTYLDLGVDAVRTHDAGGINSTGVGDTDGYQATASIFPDFENGDPADPDSYNFGPTDQLIKNIRDIGAQVFFRVGRSNRAGIDFQNEVWFNSYVPSDLDKYADVVKHIVMHYNKGWADGFYYGIKYWEIWNEPDFEPFWRGTAAEYHELYAKCALAIRSVDATAKIGGPANTTHNDYTGLEGSFLQYVKDNNLPLDFYSFHFYANKSVNPHDNARWGMYFRNLLDSYGFKQTEIMNTEYGRSLDGTPLIGLPASAAVFTAEAQMYMQDSPVDQVYSYMRITASPTDEDKAFGMVSTLNRTPQRLWTSGGDDQGFAVMAGRNEGKRELRVLIANYEIAAQNMGPIPGGNDELLNTGPIIIPPLGVYIPQGLDLGTMTYLDRLTLTYEDTNGYDVAINNIPLGWGDLTVKQYRIDNANSMTLVGTMNISKKDRGLAPVTLSGSWVHSAPSALDPIGVASGIDMIVVTGSTGSN